MPEVMRALALAALLAAAPAAAEYAVGLSSGELTVRRYEALTFYCDKLSVRDRAEQATYERCFAADGRYRVKRTAGGDELVRWGDRETAHSLQRRDGKIEHYSSVPWRAEDWQARLSDDLATRAWNGFVQWLEWKRVTVVSTLNQYEPAEETLEHVVWQGKTRAGNPCCRLWLRKSDGLIEKSDAGSGDNTRTVVVLQLRTDAAVTEEDFEEPVPFGVRYTWGRTPWTLAALWLGGIGALTFAAGVLGGFLAGVFAGSSPGRFWRFYGRAFAVVGGSLGILTFLSRDSGGHPPAIIFVLMFDFLVAAAFTAVGMGAAGLWFGASLHAARIARRT